MGGFHILHQVPRPHTSRVVSTFLNVFSLSCWNLLLSLHPGVSLTFQHRKRKVISTAEVGSARSSLLHSVYMDMCLSLRITSVEWSCGHEYVRKGQDTYKSRPYDAFFAIGHPCLVNQWVVNFFSRWGAQNCEAHRLLMAYWPRFKHHMGSKVPIFYLFVEAHMTYFELKETIMRLVTKLLVLASSYSPETYNPLFLLTRVAHSRQAIPFIVSRARKRLWTRFA